jgi:hypothetical protein
VKTARINARIAGEQDRQYPITKDWWGVHMVGQDLSGSEDKVVQAFARVYSDWVKGQRSGLPRKETLQARNSDSDQNNTLGA